MNEPFLPPNDSPPAENPHDVWLSIRPASAFLGIGPRRLNGLRKSGEVPARRRGLFGWEFRENDLMAYVERAAGVAPSPEGKASASADAASATAPSTSLADINAALNEAAAAEQAAHDEPKAEPKYEDVPPAVRMANAILVTALDCGASDIHVEPGARSTRIRLRVDGTMREVMVIPRLIHGPLTRRFCIMTDFDPFGQHLQMGRIPITHKDEPFTLRVLATPTLLGLSLTIHVIYPSRLTPGISALGLSPEVLANFDAASLPTEGGGLLLLCGPSGSGLTTTASAQLNRLNSVERNIVSLLPVAEYDTGGIHTLLVQNENGVGDVGHGKRPTVSDALSAVLRWGDVDVMFLGDITGPQTVRAALQAAESGVLTIATINAPSAPFALRRVADFAGVPQERIAHICRGVMVQRLVRRLNEANLEAYQVPAGRLGDCGLPNASSVLTRDDLVMVYRPAPNTAQGEEWSGRIGTFAFVRGDTLRQPREGLFALRQNALVNDLLQKVLMGVTTLDEAVKALR